MRRHRGTNDPQTVVNCYSLFDKFFPTCGLLDYTEGMYYENPDIPYEQAQQNQINYLLDEVKCGPGTRILEVGCGNGNLLEEVRRRQGAGIGISISPEQVRVCRQRGLDARLINYKDLGEELDHQFDAVVANGAVEHFVQPQEAAEGKADGIYQHFFRTAHRVIDPESAVRRMINTTIHFVNPPDPRDVLKSPFAFARSSELFHYAWLVRSFGGFYPAAGQFERCASGCFDLVHTTDGTYDSYLTSEAWLRRIRSALGSTKVVRILARSIPFMARHPKQFAAMITCMLITESWNWRFRTANPPTRLLRQTWEYQPG